MAVTSSKSNYKSTPTSKLSKQEYITKPENREIGTKQSSPQAANKTLYKIWK